MRARQLEVFRMVMRCGTITGAANALNVSQPALSQTLLHTESQLGFKLFDRCKGRLVPTDEAHEIFPEVERIFNDLDDLRHRIQDMGQNKAGTIRLVASTPPSMGVMPAAVRSFEKDYPDVRILSYVLPLDNICKMLVRGEAGLGLAMTDETFPLLKTEVIGHANMICVLPEDHHLCQLKVITPTDLKNETIITYRTGTLPHKLLKRSFETKGEMLQPNIELDVSFAAIAYVQQGVGVAIVDGLLPWKTFRGLITRPFKPKVPLPLSLLTSDQQPLSLNHQLMRKYIIKFSANLGVNKTSLNSS